MQMKEEVQEKKPIDEESEEQEPLISVEEMDQIVMEAFNRCIIETLNDSELPLEPSDFLKRHFSEFHMQDGSPIDLKCSSFKKIGKLLESMDKIDVLDYGQPKTFTHKVICKINRKHD